MKNKTGFWSWLFGGLRENSMNTKNDIESPVLEPSIQTNEDLHDLSNDELRAAALGVIYDTGLDCKKACFGGTIEKCDRALANIPKAREKYANVEPERLRRAIMYWIDYFEKEAQDNRDDIISKKSIQEEKEAKEKWRATEERKKEIKRRIKNHLGIE